MNIIQKITPNFAKGRSGRSPEMIVIHVMAGSLSGTDNWFANPESGVSSHYGVGFNGEIHQYVKEEDTAWANGQVISPSSKIVFSRPNVNPNLYTLSIEHEGQDLAKAPETQLNASVELVRTLIARYNIPCDRDHIIGHYEIKNTKPNCPAVDKTIIDKIIERVKQNPDKEKTKVEIKRLLDTL